MAEDDTFDPKDKEYVENLGKENDKNEREYKDTEILAIKTTEYYELLRKESKKKEHPMSTYLQNRLVLDYQRYVLEELAIFDSNPEDE